MTENGLLSELTGLWRDRDSAMSDSPQYGSSCERHSSSVLLDELNDILATVHDSDTESDPAIQYGISDELIDPWCDLCHSLGRRKVEANSYCQECNVFLCIHCLEAHEKSRCKCTVQHGDEMPKSQAEKPIKYEECSVHPGTACNILCLDHSLLTCKLCNQKCHNRCTTKLLPAFCKDVSTHIQNYTLSIDSMREHRIYVKTMIENNKTDIEKQRKKLVTETEKQRDEILLKTTALFSSMIATINDVCQQISSDFSRQIQALSDRVEGVENFLSEIDERTVSSGGYELKPLLDVLKYNYKWKSETKSEMEDAYKLLDKVKLSFSLSHDIANFLSSVGCVRKETTDILKPAPLTEILDGIPENVLLQAPNESPDLNPSGKVHNLTHESENDIHAVETGNLREEEASPQNVSGLSPSTAIPLTRHKLIKAIKPIKMGNLQIKTSNDKKQCHADGLNVTKNGTMLVSDWNNKKIKAFSLENKLLSSLKLRHKPQNIAIASSSTALVNLKNGKICVLDISNIYSLSVLRIISLGCLISSLTLCDDILAYVKNNAPKRLKVFDSDHELWSQPLLKKPGTIKTNNLNGTTTVVITDLGDDTITIFDAGVGTLINRVKVQEKKPLGLAIDCSGNIYVSFCQTKEVSVWSSDLTYFRTLLSGSDLHSQPRYFAFNNTTNELLVTYKNTDFVGRFQLNYAEHDQ